jgi:hypothetical protein
MPRSPRLLAVLLAVSGCSGLQDCGARPPAPSSRPATAPVVAASSAAPDQAALAAAAPYAKSWWVLLHSSATPGEGGEALEALKQTGLSAEPLRLSTTPFRDLRPCLEAVVARMFMSRAEALDFQARLREAGVVADVKYAGPLQAGRGVACRAGEEAQRALIEGPRRREAPRFVESHVGRTFMLLAGSQGSHVLEPMDVRRGVWMAPAPGDPTGLFSAGDRVDVYGARGLLQGGCAVKGFTWINRGVPALDYFLREPPPESPGCGRAWAFAELDCAVPPEEWGFALPAGTPAPVFFTASEAPAELVTTHESALRGSPRFAESRAEALLQSERVGEKLKVEVNSFSYNSGEWRALFSVARLRVGEGHSLCGMDYDQQVTRAVVMQPGAAARVLPMDDLSGDTVVGVMDLEGDGRMELLLRDSWPAPWVRLVREDGTEVAGAVVEHCDSGC